MHRTPNDNNNRIYKEPLKNEGSTTNTGLKRSLSSPNLAQVKKSKTENQVNIVFVLQCVINLFIHFFFPKKYICKVKIIFPVLFQS